LRAQEKTLTVRSIAEAPERLTQGPLARHLEQTICVRLLNEWALRAGLDLNDPCHRLAPRTVRAAEQFMIEHAAELPTMADVARAVGTSVRTLSAAFKSFRGYPPSAFLREQRLQGARRVLSAAPPGASVSAIAAAWGYINMGEFARSYRLRFGERPSDTLRRGTA
jgi:transcriptional regulator GlxA family with amidase domain